ncbi:IclR family transcriptional regulator [Oceanobacillus picturae]|uniref:IclR family transcriptional regulator n=1 Tax=Oceanobacillus picturae TaxID=171693 RepID=UPI00363EE4E9
MVVEKRTTSSIEKALQLLNCFTNKNFQMTAEDLAEETGIPRSSVFRMLATLEEYRYIKRTKTAHKTWYELGYAFFEKGAMVQRQFNIREYARSRMMELRNEWNLNIQLAVRDGIEALYVEQIQSWRPIRLYPAVGRRAPLYAASCPRILLAYMEKSEREALLNEVKWKKFTHSTPVKSREIDKTIEQILETGYSISRGELIEGTTGIAVPIFNPVQNEVLAALSVVGLDADFEKEEHYYIEKLKEAALEIQEDLTT